MNRRIHSCASLSSRSSCFSQRLLDTGRRQCPCIRHGAHSPPELIAQADEYFSAIMPNAPHLTFALRMEFSYADGSSNKLRASSSESSSNSSNKSNARDWVLLFHGVADNRVGDLGVADFLLRAGYGVVMMDSRAHGESEGDLATYGWKERDDVRVVVAISKAGFIRMHFRVRSFHGRWNRFTGGRS